MQSTTLAHQGDQGMCGIQSGFNGSSCSEAQHDKPIQLPYKNIQHRSIPEQIEHAVDDISASEWSRYGMCGIQSESVNLINHDVMKLIMIDPFNSCMQVHHYKYNKVLEFAVRARANLMMESTLRLSRCVEDSFRLVLMNHEVVMVSLSCWTHLTYSSSLLLV